MTQVQFSPKTDGIDHVNIYSRAKTFAGKMLTNFAATPFTMHGQRFASVEGFYHSMLFKDPKIRQQVAASCGGQAKSWAKKSTVRPGDLVLLWDGRQLPFRSEEFYAEVMLAVRVKLVQNPQAAELLAATGDLPLEHYYVMWGKPVVPHGSREIFLATLNQLRDEMQRNGRIAHSPTLAG